MEKAELEERKVYMTLYQTKQKPHQAGKASKHKGESPPPPPVLLSRTDHTFAFAPAPYDLGEQVKFRLIQNFIELPTLSEHDLSSSFPGVLVPAVWPCS